MKDISYLAEKEEIRKLKRELSTAVIEKEQALMEQDRLLHELLETRNSVTYRLAKCITFIPRWLRGLKYRSGRLPENQTLYPYMVSFVIAVYNTADFLAEMLDSILAQKQDVLASFLRRNGEAVFKKHVYENIYEIILVDDGSTDGSEDICDTYAGKYPWIKVLHKENGGVSSARNAGISIAQGKYITFPDSDDKLSENVMEACFTFFEAHERKISMVTYPLRFFDAQSGDHWTTYRFEHGTRILNMMDEWDKPQYFTAASFFKTAALKNQITFDSRLINGEDIKLAHEILYRDKPMIGLVDSCTYWYRRRSTGEQSAVQTSKNTKEYYIPYLKDLLAALMDEAERVYGEVPKYVQYAVMGQLQWRLRSDGSGALARTVIGEEDFQEYRRLILELIKRIDLDVIMEQKQLFREHLFYLGNIKTAGQVQRKIEHQNILYYFNDIYCTDAASCYLKLEFMKIRDGILYLEGAYANLEQNCINWILMKDSASDEEQVSGEGARKQVEGYDMRKQDVQILGQTALYVESFRVEVPLQGTDGKIYFGSTVGGVDVVKTRVVLGKFMPLSKELSKSYYSEAGWTVRLEKNSLRLWNVALLPEAPDFEQEFEEQIEQGSYENRQEVMEALAIRKQALIRRAWKRSGRQIWLISDRYHVADDNGEAFFRYMAAQENLPIQCYFVIAGDSKDFERLSEIGRVVAQDSREHMLLHLTADCIISSQADEYIIDPVWRKDFVNHLYKDLYCRKKYVFLQHGVIKDDLSAWLNRFNKNIDGFVCTAWKEAQSVCECDYYYDDEQVWLTGLPRYDRLYHNEKNYILIMPTWRKWLMQDFNAVASDRDATHVKNNIEETEYFRFYNALLNDTALLEVCENYGYKVCFMPHSNLRESMGSFDRDERVLFFDFDKKYRDAFAEAALLVTDYSSTAMDFAYLRKPVLYAQFDKERFFSGEHTYEKGYFEYEQDGFGEVVYDLGNLVKEMISYIRNGCTLKESYRERIDQFFAYDDRNNCKRVFEKIAVLMSFS